MTQQPHVDVPSTSIFRVVEAVSRRVPDKTAIELIGVNRCTYRQLVTQAENAAAALVAAGVSFGDRVIMMGNNRIEFLELQLACARIGAIFAPLGPSLRGPVLRGMVDLADPAIFIAEEEWRERVEEVWTGKTRFLAPPAAAPTDWSGNADALEGLPTPDADALALIMFTSGTTGQSKGVMWTHRTYNTMAFSSVTMNELGEDDILHTALPISHGNGLILTVYSALVLGATAVVSPRFSASGYEEELAETGATFTNILGSMSHILLDQPKSSHAVKLKKAFTIPVSPDIQKAIEARFGCIVTSAYGLSDAGLPILTGVKFPEGSCGRILSQIWEARVTGPDGNEVPAGKSGELWVRSTVKNASAVGFWRMEQETAERYRDGWVGTGDIFRFENGWYYFVDRAKDAIRRRGENISSQEVETAIMTHPDVAECAVYPVPSEMSEDEVMTAILLRAGRTVTETDLIRHIEKQLPYFAVPRFIRWVEEFPRTDTQKIQKMELRRIGVTPQTWDREKSGYKLSR